MSEGSSGIEQSPSVPQNVATVNKTKTIQLNQDLQQESSNKERFGRLKQLLARFGKKQAEQPQSISDSLTPEEFGRESVTNFVDPHSNDHFISVLEKSEAIRVNPSLRLEASRFNAEGVSEEAIIEVLEKGEKASAQAVNEVFTRFIRHYAEVGKLSEDNVGGLEIGKATLEAAKELEKRIPKKAVQILLNELNSFEQFVDASKLSDQELFALSAEITPLVNNDFNMISIPEEARKYFASHLSKNKLFTPEQREEALKTLEKWYTGNYNTETGKLTLYRFVNMRPEMLDDIIQNGVSPRGVRTAGNEEAVLQYLDKNGGGGWYNTLAKAFRLQKAGEDISEFVEQYKKDSRSGFDYDLATYWTTENESRLFGNSGYRIAVELDPKEAWRSITLRSIKKGRIDDDYSLSTISFDEFSRGQFEWTVLGNVSSSKIKEVLDLSSKRDVLKKEVVG